MQARLSNYSDFQFSSDNHWRQFQLEYRDRDRQDRVSAFKVKAQKFHTVNLFNIECVTLDLFDYALALAPKLAPLLIGGCDSNSDTSQEELDSLEVLTSKELHPLYRMLRTLFC